ncbi:hypothetical protein MHPYR_340060 [uncultured Mycobacterium sp.]|uniref:Uncharacterized protein n=1 Tax=uncultured Mycobacterium sp. TaxID=171292 RepID=A0A1Y5PKE2_9MYCO|nr:hypothetical protein MHPYR_340060 [uncultured Mycobacterium sp.]
MTAIDVAATLPNIHGHEAGAGLSYLVICSQRYETGGAEGVVDASGRD